MPAYAKKVRSFGRDSHRITLSIPGAEKDRRPDPRGWGALLKEDEVAFVDVERENSMERKDPRGYLTTSAIFVASEFRRRGLGRALYEEALALAKKNGFEGIASDPEDRNAASDPFWARAPTHMGWQVRTASLNTGHTPSAKRVAAMWLLREARGSLKSP